MIRGAIIFAVLLISVNFIFTKPSFNASSGCAGSGCHSQSAGAVNVTLIGDNQIQVEVSGVSNNQDVAGELVDMNGDVVDVINSTRTNPFILTAPAAGKYLINAGYKEPNLRWDSTSVELVITDIFDDSHGFVKEFEVFTNYPNPFNSSTVIRFSIINPTQVLLTVYDISGREVARLVDDKMQPGTYNRIFEAKDLASGLHFYQLRADGLVQTKKLTLIK